MPNGEGEKKKDMGEESLQAVETGEKKEKGGRGSQFQLLGEFTAKKKKERAVTEPGGKKKKKRYPPEKKVLEKKKSKTRKTGIRIKA